MKTKTAQRALNKRRIRRLWTLRAEACAAFCLLSCGALAGSRSSANYSITADAADSGGRRAASANYTNHGSAALIAGTSTVAAPPRTAKAGFIAQLYDVTGLVVNSAVPNVTETATLQLAAWQLLDDATYLGVTANLVNWSVSEGPITGISVEGLATADSVYQDTPATVEGAFGGFTALLNLTVLDTIADNFGMYAGDGVGDDWQVQFFGFDNPEAAPGLDPDGDGGTNAFEFTAGLIPTDPNSVFHLRLEAVPGQPTHRNIVFSPRLDGRIYIVEARATLEVAWEPLVTLAESDNGEERTVTDLDATDALKFYRVEISKP